MVEFVKKLRLNNAVYVFAVATCGGTPAKALLQLQKLLRKSGADLNAGFAVKEGANTVADAPGFVLFIKRINKKIYTSGMDRLAEIIDTVKGNKLHKPDTSSFAVNFLGNLIYKLVEPYYDKMGSMDENFSVDPKCIGCHTCERICPNENIIIKENKPVWQHKCGQCNACIQWCPQQAIHFKNETCRYRNPGIKAEDLMLR